MRKGIKVASVVLFSFLLLILGCQSAPQKELNAAKDALQKAQEAEADKYAPDLFIQAQDAIGEAENLIAQKKYSEAKKLLLDAKGVAESAIPQTETNKDEIKTQVEDFMAAIDNAMKQLHETQDLAQQWKIPEGVWKLADEMTRWDEGLKRARAEYDAGNYFLAKQLIAQIHQELTQKDNELRNMIMAKEGKK
jgi:hypothetical protein